MRRTLIMLALLMAPAAFGQARTVNPTGPLASMSVEEIKYFTSHFDKVSLMGTLTVPRKGEAKINFSDSEHPDGFEIPPSCDLKTAIIDRWLVTNSTEFTSFKARRGTIIDWTCTGYMWKPGMRGKL